MKAQGYFSVVIYEDRCMNELIKQIYYVDECLDRFVMNYEIIVVLKADFDEDMYSNLSELNERIKGNVILVRLSYSHNIESAIMAGVDISIGDYIYEIDRDSNPSTYESIENMYIELTKQKCDIAFLRPKNIGLMNRLIMKILNRKGNGNIVLGKNLVRLVTRRSLNAVDIQYERDNTRNLMFQQCGLKNTNIYCKTKSKQIDSNFNKELSYLVRFKNLGCKAAYFLGCIYLLIFLGVIIFGEIQKESFVPLFLLSFSILLALIGILINHLLLLYREVKGAKYYIVQEVRRLK